MALSPDLTLLYRFGEVGSVGDLSPRYAGYGPTLTHTRASEARYYDSSGILQTAGTGVARTHSYTPDGATLLGLLVEDSATNDVAYSEDFSQAWWGLLNLTATPGQPDPAGGTSASILDDQETGADATTRSNRPGTDHDSDTFSIYLKQNAGITHTSGFASIILVLDGGTVARGYINLTTGAWATQSDTIPGDVTVTYHAPEAAANGYRRYVITLTRTAATRLNCQIYIRPATLDGSTSNTQTGALDVYGAQMEEGQVATSYITTTGVAVTRPADVVSTSDVSWWNAAGGNTKVAYVRGSPGDGYFHEISNGSIAEYNTWRPASVNVQNYYNSSTGQWFPSIVHSLSLDATSRLVCGIAANDHGYTIDGATVQTNATAGLLQNVNRMVLGPGGAVAPPPVLYFTEIRSYNTRRPDTEAYTGPGTGGLNELSLGQVPEEEDTGAPIAPPAVSSASLVAWNLTTNTQLYTKQDALVNNCASLTKIMTMRILLQYYPTQAALEAVDYTMVADDIVGGTGAGLQVGDVLNLYQLLQCLLLPSDNNAANAIANHVGTVDLGGDKNTFITEMNAQATALGMSNTTYVGPAGHPETNTSTAEDGQLLWETQYDHPVPVEIWKKSYIRTDITRGVTFSLAVFSGSYVQSDPGMRGRHKEGIGSGYHGMSHFIMPNGEEVSVSSLNAVGRPELSADHRAVYWQLRTDFPELDTPANPWTPAVLFTEKGYGGAWWTASQGTWQDSVGGTPAGDGDPVLVWEPAASNNAGGLVFTARGAGVTREVDALTGESTLNNAGTTNFDLGSQTIAGTGLFSDAVQEPNGYMVLCNYRTTDTDCVFVARAASSGALRQFWMFLFGPDVNLGNGIGMRQNFAYGGTEQMNNDQWQIHAGLWDGTTPWQDSGGTRLFDNIGTSGTVAINIEAMGRNNGANGVLTGRMTDIIICDRWDEEQLLIAKSWLRSKAEQYVAPQQPVGNPYQMLV